LVPTKDASGTVTFDCPSSAKADLVPVCFNSIMANDPHGDWRKSIADAHKVWNDLRLCDKCSRNAPFHCIKMASVRNIIKGIEGSAIAKICFLCVHGPAHNYANGLYVCSTCTTIMLQHGNSTDTTADNRQRFMNPLKMSIPGIQLVAADIKDFIFKADGTVTPDSLFNIVINGFDRSMYVVMEEDTEGHKSNNEKVEATRLNRIVDAFARKGHHVLVIRYDAKKKFDWMHPTTLEVHEQQEMPFDLRLIIIRAWINWYVRSMMDVLNPNVMPLVTLLYMFYDYDNLHFKNARRLYGQSKDSIFHAGDSELIKKLRKTLNTKFTSAVGLAWTFPQEFEGRHEIDWKYALHPNEGYVLDRLDKTIYKACGILRSATIEHVLDQ
jgi:hypothetical protein